MTDCIRSQYSIKPFERVGTFRWREREREIEKWRDWERERKFYIQRENEREIAWKGERNEGTNGVHELCGSRNTDSVMVKRGRTRSVGRVFDHDWPSASDLSLPVISPHREQVWSLKIQIRQRVNSLIYGPREIAGSGIAHSNKLDESEVT